MAPASSERGGACARSLPMKRVLMVTDGLDNGGAERQMTLLARNLPAGYEVEVFSLRDGPYAAVLRSAGIPLRISARAWRYDISPAFGLWREIARWRPDIVHSWGWMSDSAAAVACAVLRVARVNGTIRNARLPERWAGITRFLAAHADAVIANSQAGLDAYELSIPTAFVVHNGFEAGRAALGRRAMAPEPRAIPEIVMAARMVPEKDFDTLLDAAELLRRSGARARFTLMGTGADRERLEDRGRALAEAGTGVTVTDCGLEVMPVLAAADIGVLLTDPRHHAEGLSNSIMEYMACGLPVVCTDSGGNREIVVDGETGTVVPPCDPPAVADALRRLLDEPETARRFGEAGKRRIDTAFSTKVMVDKTISVYESVLRAGQRSASR